MTHTPKFKTGDKVYLLPDRITIYSIIRVHSNQYGFPIYDLSNSVTDVSEQNIDTANIKYFPL